MGGPVRPCAVPALRQLRGTLVLLAVVAALQGCKRQPDAPAPPPPTPFQLADRLRPRVVALVAEERYAEAIDLALVEIEDDTARRPLVEEVLAAAAERERSVSVELEDLIAHGEYSAARARLQSVRATLPATTDGARFLALDKRLTKVIAESEEAEWMRRYASRVDRVALDAFGRRNWRRLVEAVQRWAALPGDAAARAEVLACAPAPGLLRAAIAACAVDPSPPAEAAVVRRVVRISKRELFGREDAEGALAVEYALALPRWEPGARLPLLLSLFPPQAMDLAHVEEGFAQSFALMATTGPFAIAGVFMPEGLAWTDYPAGAVLARAIARDISCVAPIDVRRRYLDGPGDGGAGAWHVALTDPGPWAGIAPMGAPFEASWLPLLANLRELAVHVTHRPDDPVVSMAGAQSAVDALRAAGHPRVVVRPLGPGPEEPERAAREMIDFMLGGIKAPSRDAMQLRFVGPAATAVGSVRAVVFVPNREEVDRTRMTMHGGVVNRRFTDPPALAISIRDNVIHVTPEGVESFELLVPVSRVDFDRPIEIVQMGRRLARIRVAPTADQVLDLASAYPDDEYVAVIPIKCRVVKPGDRFTERGIDPAPIAAYGREKFEALVADLTKILDAPELDRDAIARVCAAAPEEPVLAAAVELALRPRLVEPGAHPFRIDLPSHPMQCYVYVPATKPGERLPLVIDLHGGGGGGGAEHLSQAVDRFRGLSEEFGPVMGVLPHSPTPLGWGPSAPGLEQVSRVIRDLSRHVPLDMNRIYLGGFSMGGFGSWTSALIDPTPFAAILPTAGRIHPFMLPLMSNLDHVGVNVAHRVGDAIVPVDGARRAKAALEALGHTNLVYREYPGVEHSGATPEDERKRIQWMLAQRRVAHPERVRMKVLAPRPTRHRDLVAREFDSQRPVHDIQLKGANSSDLTEAWFQTPAAIDVAFPKGSNTVEITGVDGISSLEILLAPEVFDFSKPIVVRAGERELYAGVVPATLGTRLELLRRFPDGDYRASIVIDTRAGDVPVER